MKAIVFDTKKPSQIGINRNIPSYNNENESSTEHEESEMEDGDGHAGVICTEESDIDQSDHDDDSKKGSHSNARWADSIAKILKANKPKGKKTLVLSRAKKITDLKSKKQVDIGFQIETEGGQIKEETLDPLESLSKEHVEEPSRKRRKEILSLRVKPNILNRDRERMLTKIATKGVVQLFNAVKCQQKDLNKKLNEAGTLDVKREKILKNIDKQTFLDVLMGQKIDEVGAAKRRVRERKNVTSTNGPKWSVLRDDFMMGAKFKDWDKELEVENEVEFE